MSAMKHCALAMQRGNWPRVLGRNNFKAAMTGPERKMAHPKKLCLSIAMWTLAKGAWPQHLQSDHDRPWTRDDSPKEAVLPNSFQAILRLAEQPSQFLVNTVLGSAPVTLCGSRRLAACTLQIIADLHICK